MTPPSSAPITILTSTPSWYGSHSGYYEQLVRGLRARGQVRVLRPPQSQAARLVGKAYAALKGLPPRDQRLSLVEARARQVVERDPSGVVHVANIEAHLPILRHWDSAPRNLIATIHQPPSWWSDDDLALLARCNSAILLYERDVAFFERFVGAGRVSPIPHGVDTSFFTDAPEPARVSRRVLFCGQWLRDFDMLVTVVDELLARAPDASFDLLIPKHAQQEAALVRLQTRPRVAWHAAVSDTRLRELYRTASVAIFPLRDTAANNAVVECLACALPIVATDVGGIRDYGGGDLFPVVPRGDAAAMAAEVLRLFDDDGRRLGIGGSCRRYAEQSLAWPITVELHVQAYARLIR